MSIPPKSPTTSNSFFWTDDNVNFHKSTLKPDEVNGFMNDPKDVKKKSSVCGCFNRKAKHKKQPTIAEDIDTSVQKTSMSIIKEEGNL
jgi:hypothetical protein